MQDPWLDRISEYIDGDMGPADARAFETHLAGCADCRATLETVRGIVAAAAALADHAPVRDLWPGIAAGIAADAVTPAPDAAVAATPAGYGAVRPDAARGSIPLRAVDARRFSFSTRQLAAAALVLMSVSAGAAWLLTGTGSSDAVYQQGTIFQAAGSEPADVRMVGVPEPAAPPQPSATTIDEALAAARASLDPATVEVLERSIESINAAIADAHAALEADPGNPYLQRQLDSTLQRRQDVLRRAHRVQRAGT
jgi:anti-sigma factor RsiW